MTEEQFDELHRWAFAIAYPMLRSVSEAEEVVQERFLRLHRARESAERIEPLCRIATSSSPSTSCRRCSNAFGFLA